MFRRSLYIFGAIVLLGLALTIGYALLGFHGPHGAIADARARFAEGEYLRVVADLDLHERSVTLQRDPSKRRELLSLRYRAHSELSSYPAALRDLERLMADTPEHTEEMRLDHIRLLALTGDGERALQEARAFLADQPDHGRALELAGEACQTTYQEELRAVLAAVELDVGPQTIEELQSDLLAYLYRPESDPEIEQALESLRQTYAGQSRLVAVWPPLAQRLAALRSRIQESLTYFQRSLELGGQPVAAFGGLALSLEQSERFDDLLLLCECYRRRFDHKFVFDAGAIAAWALVRLELHENAIATALRWLPPSTIEQRLEQGTLGPKVPKVLDLQLARTVAAWQRRDLPALHRQRPELRALMDAGMRLQLVSTLVNGFSAYLRESREPCERAFASATRIIRRFPTPHGQQDLLALIVPPRLDNLRASGASDAEITAVCNEWIALRPNEVEPLLALAEYQLEAGKDSGAMATVRAAQKLAPADETVLALRVRAARQLYGDTDQDGVGLLAQCRKRSRLTPEVPDPVCFLLCGEAALDAGVDRVALACARAAVDAMPWSRKGRLLEARAELLAGQPAAAAQVLRKLVDSMPPDRETLQLALESHRAAGLPASGFLWIAMRNVRPDFAIATDLLRLAQNDAPAAALPLARALLARDDLPTELLVLTAASFARAGERRTAERLLGKLELEGPEAEPELATVRADLARTVASLLLLAADSGTKDAGLSRRAAQWILEYGFATAPAAPALLAAARELAASHPDTAYEMLTTALAVAAPEHKNGADYALAGDLALRRGQLALAESHWTAALAFPDGRRAAEPLARLCLATDRPERALRVYALATDASDPALALRCGRLALADRLVKESNARDGGDLLTQVTLAVVGAPSLAADLVFENDADREATLELASLLRADELAAAALPRAKALAERLPGTTTTLLLARAQSMAGNQSVASRLHRELWTQGVATLPYWREVAAATCRRGYEPAPVVEGGLAAAAAKGTLASSPFAFAVATMRMADAVEKSGHDELALGYRAEVWLQFVPDLGLPARCRPTLAGAAALRAAGRPLDAWWVLDRLRNVLPARERAAVVDQMLAIADDLAADQDPGRAAQRETVYGAVADLATTEGPYGGIVHYLLAHAKSHPSLAPAKARRIELLEGHLGLAGSGADSGEHVAATVARLVSDRGLEPTLSVVEARLRDHPLALDLWRERAGLLQKLRRSAEGVADLRRVLAHVVSPPHVLDLVARAAEELALQPADIAALGKLGKPLKESARGRFVRGLVALRRGQPDKAVPLLEQAGDEGGEIRLLAMAQALLQTELADSAERAAQVLERLAADYPSSSHARYAGSFARQLAPR